jgi:hypothetical protein
MTSGVKGGSCRVKGGKAGRRQVKGGRPRSAIGIRGLVERGWEQLLGIEFYA